MAKQQKPTPSAETPADGLIGNKEDLTSIKNDIEAREANVTARENAIAERENEVSTRENDLEAREANVTARENAIAERENKVSTRENDLEAREANVTARENAIAQNPKYEKPKPGEKFDFGGSTYQFTEDAPLIIRIDGVPRTQKEIAAIEDLKLQLVAGNSSLIQKI
ncbi:DUF3552 domain-containing protein [Riemerella anatipestifer]|uniref:DUF3552 domain-containing protein n=1 Tax=Riemerella anatipestifer TaxID=34085 RepID=UPI0007ECFEE6|nr:DUF3552 domain-containing protein [Riemerella anatipestifer]MDD1549119.1 DUF3552 domain-containing protein [Riemerella anatipestifer]MDR7831941.1 DUF3552 domain-containing protein [Riemerella anatipestifer]MDY3402464.1 DUF3552 domain-containing protein [Riemerella anatipestifer]OBP62807.1 hypothetical protein AWB84_06785 [Riemerella anatipestifer]QZO83714.1 DUF3552 domain-containing protein [Riemerella anatipestifer]